MNPAARLQQAYADFQRGNFHQAEITCREVLAGDENIAEAWHLLALLAERANRPDDARAHAEKAVKLARSQPGMLNHLAMLCEARGELRDAEEKLLSAIRAKPDYAVGFNNLGEVYKRWGRGAEATAAYRRAIELAPDFAAARSNLLMSLLYAPDLSQDDVEAEHRRVAGWWSQKFVARTRYPNNPDRQRRIRLGYVSPDLREHAVMRFFEPLLAAHDRERFEIFLYSECPIVDRVGERLRKWGDHWHVTWTKGPHDVADQIERDRIDLLIDLAGHTRNNRLDVLALRPAPVQITYLGYPNITGLAAIDYRITDAMINPVAEAAKDQPAPTSEELVRLPGGVACFAPPVEAPPVSPVPSTTAGCVRFASHHPLIKLNDQVLACWRAILDKLPSARLVFFRSDLHGDAADALREQLQRHGFPLDRVELRKVSAEPTDYLAQYADVDLVLDAFPFTGHTMTCEALWMGVPTVTLLGARPSGRLSASVLNLLGLDDLIASSTDDYVTRAIAWATDDSRRALLRQQLRSLIRERLAAGGWIKGLEAAYRQMWQAWCARPDKQAPDDPSPANGNPTDADSLVKRGDALRAKGQLAAAAECYRQAADSPTALAHLGEMHEEQGQFIPAQTAYEAAARLEPWSAQHPLRLGNLLTATGQYQRAEQQYRQAVAVEPRFFPAWAMLGQTYANQGRLAEAEQAYHRALAARDDAKLRIVMATLLPQIYASTGEALEYRQRLTTRLAELHARQVRVDPTREIIPNFFLLAYQSGNLIEPQRSFASLFAPTNKASNTFRRPAPSADGRVRVGILSQYFCNHTIGTLNRGLVAQLDRQRFHLTVISAARADDETARHYRAHADRFVPLSLNLDAALRTMRELDLDILLYADLGMSCLAMTLACSRFAPVQCVTWGHPVTTGLPTIDYFLSGELYETPEADAHYTERLVRLPGLQTCYPRPELLTTARTRADLGLADDAHLYACPQTLFKFHPEFDPILAEILRRDPRGRLILIEGRHRTWTEKLRERWSRTMPDVLERVQFLSPLARPDFLAVCRHVDVLLDPLHFGGGNTTLEGLHVTTPVVTWPTPFLRARLADGMYRHCGWTDCIADSAAQYVDIAVRLGSEPDANRAARRAIAECSGALFEHTASIRAFEDFFSEAHAAARREH